ncbi:hypothetical protein FSP39_016355 [Pinctada imbricata]|uniref:Uncharacterized protein n=1 Tax=Pinctada imbricata TaxID=66713 RepID=A0AA88YD39_PINIB|nr:hypothetical protein FSP39_016355 [Pinctada imbricata]
MGPKILTLFTTWNVSMESSYVYNNTINILSSFLPEINLVVFLPEEDIEFFDVPSGWTVLPISRVDCGDTPVLKNMFFDVYEKFESTFYGYLNADILLDRGIIETLHAVKAYMFIKGKKQVLISGKRIDLYLDKIKRKYISTQKDVEYLSQVGTIAYGYAEDFFITTKTYPWRYIPDLVIGRPKYDNYLVYMSRQRSVPVIDASMTILALHQRTQKRIKIKDECNERILKKAKKYNFKFIQRGNLECATYETRYNRDGKIYIYRRGQFTTKC